MKKYSLNNILLSNEILNAYVNKFWVDIFDSLNISSERKHLYLLTKVFFIDSKLGYRTLGHLVKVNYEDKDLFATYLQERLGLLSDAYITFPIDIIKFSYIIRDGKVSEEDSRVLFRDLSDKGITSHIFNNKKLPISMEAKNYGEIISISEFTNFTRNIVSDGIRVFQIDINSDKSVNTVKILGLNKFEWIDTKLNEGFKREIGKSTIYFVDGEKILQKIERTAKPFKQRLEEKSKNNNFLTFDIETINKDGKIIPYLINAYNGKEHITSYSNINLDQGELFQDFISKLLSLLNKKEKIVIYAHNLSSFDGIFLLKHLINNPQKLSLEPLVFNGRLISISFKTKDNKLLIFKDSYLLLPISLRKLCKAFKIKVENSKGNFPYLINDINYKGKLPSIEHWSDITAMEYHSLKKEYENKEWNFKFESINYCKLDCKSLYKVLTIFNELIFKEFKVNINKSLTLPSLAMRIYKTHYMPKDMIYQLLGNIEYEIRESYTGGAVDMYIPLNKNNEKLFYYDYNSLYPTSMAYNDIPVGKPTYFEGDILRFENNAFGFFYCRISSPKYLDHPILQRKIKTKDGLRTIAGLGDWEGWIFSEEMKNAIKYGYKFEIIKGYQFSRGNLFKDYIEKMYSLRKQFDKSHPMNLTAKLLMNSLYGKFGMKVEMTRVEMFDTSTEELKLEFAEKLKIYGESIYDFVQVGDTFLIIRNSLANMKFDEEDEMYYGLDVNIAIASSITAYSRMYMTRFKNNRSYNLYYSDTDSIIIDKELPRQLVGDKLGQLKLEYKLNKGVFLAPKVYALILENGSKIIKVKGLTEDAQKEISVNDFENLLIKDSTKEFTQTKWFKKILNSEISISDVIYTLKITSNKRECVYNNNNILTYTKPFNYLEITP